VEGNEKEAEVYVTDERLTFYAKQSLAIAKTELRVRKQLGGVLVAYRANFGLHRLTKVEGLFRELAGEAWLNDGGMKQAICETIRALNRVVPVEAMGMVTAVNMYVETDGYRALPVEERERVKDADWKNPRYFTASEALVANLQTAERVCLYIQPFRGGLLVGDPNVKVESQEDFAGRMRFYGDAPPEMVEHLRQHLGELGFSPQ
jgi:hypothetical protein